MQVLEVEKDEEVLVQMERRMRNVGEGYSNVSVKAKKGKK